MARILDVSVVGSFTDRKLSFDNSGGWESQSLTPYALVFPSLSFPSTSCSLYRHPFTRPFANPTVSRASSVMHVDGSVDTSRPERTAAFEF